MESRRSETRAGKRDEAALIIRNGLVVTADWQAETDIRIRGERIEAIARHLVKGHGGEREIDAKGLLVLPGGIDPHVHLTMPESDRRADDFTSGSEAALAGGITTLGNISFARPGETPLATLRREGTLAQQQAIADFVLHPVLQPPTEASIQELPQLAAAGHTSIKLFTCFEDFDRNASAYLRALQTAGEIGLLTMVHCEDFAVIASATEDLLSAGRGSLRYFADSRPVVAEVVATHRVVGMCEATGAPVYIVHVSCERALRICEEARARALPIYIETRPLYLYCTRERYHDADGGVYTAWPPLRGAEDQAALWEALLDGRIHTLATDHCPLTREEKLDPSLTVANARPGLSNLQLSLPMLYSDGVLKRKLSLPRFVSLTSTNAAKLFGLYPRKGTIAVGADADLALWDPDQRRIVRGGDLRSRAGFSIYEGAEVTGWPRMVIRRGQVVYEAGRITAEPGSGRWLQRRCFADPFGEDRPSEVAVPLEG